MSKAIEEAKAAKVHTVRIEGNGDVAEVCRLTCMEHNIAVSTDSTLPTLHIVGLKVFFEMEDHRES